MIIKREQSTLLKGIAILTVIFAHANGGKITDIIPILNNSKLMSIFCQGGMALFLLLSGYGVFTSYLNNGLRSYWDKKFKKIFIPAIFLQICYFVFTIIKQYIQFKEISIDWTTVVGSVFCISSKNSIDGAMWYLSYLFFCYMSFYIFFTQKKQLGVRVCVFSIYWIISMLFSKQLWPNSFYCVSSFGIGVIYSYITNVLRYQFSNKIKIIIVVVSILAGTGYYFYFRQNTILDNIASNLIAFMIIILSTITDCKKLKVLYFIGVHSFYLYLLQGKIIFGIFSYDNHSEYINLIAFVVLFLLAILVATIYDMLLKKCFMFEQNNQ